MTVRDRSFLDTTRFAILFFLLIALATAVLSQDVKPPIRSALDAADTVQAIDLLNKDIQVDPAFSVNYYTLGRIYFERGQYEKARDQFLVALDKRKKDSESQYYLGLSYLHLNDLPNAEAQMDEGRKKFKDARDRFEDGYGLVMMAKKDYKAADRAFRQALIGDSANPGYLVHLGDANFFQNVPSLAVGYYEKALKSDTASTEVYFHWAEACLEMKDYTCAIEKLRIVLTKDSTHAPAWMRAGSIYFKAGLSTTARDERANRFKEAIGSYKRYLELSHAKPDSTTVRAYFEMAMSYANLFGFEEAIPYYEQVLAIPYEPRDIYFNYGKALFWGTKDYDRSAEMFLKHLDWVGRQNKDYVPSVSLAEVYQLLGDSYYYRKPSDFTSAVTYYKKSLELDPNQKKLLQNAAVAYHSLKSYGQAIEYYEKRIALGIDSSSSPIYKNAGFCALNLAGNTTADEGMSLDDPIISPDTTTPAVSVDSTRNYFKVAVEYFENYLKYFQTDTKVLTLAGNTYLFQLKDCQGGLKYFEKLLTLDPRSCEAKRAIGFAYFGGLCAKNYSKALTHLLDAYDCIVKAKGACADVDLVLWVAQAYHLRAVERAGDKAGANADFKAAYEWYGRVLKCDANNKDAKKGQSDTRFEFN